ncbi:MAG: hypothetical protein ACI9MR_001599 [Myxococcota bacterium]|jgi:hypothetical protein
MTFGRVFLRLQLMTFGRVFLLLLSVGCFFGRVFLFFTPNAKR